MLKTASLENSIKLKELGVKQISDYYWWKSPDGTKADIFPKHLIPDWADCYSAFTVSELGEMFNEIGADLFIKAYGEVFNFKGTQNVGVLGVINLMRNPDKSSKMVIYLKEQNLI
ncbi:MAG: hypothetical protein WC438_06090 [Candidatus Pacearchaeota archaeon]